MTKTGEGEGNGDRGVRNKPETKEEKTLEEKKNIRMITIIDGGGKESQVGAPSPKSTLSCRRGLCFYTLPERKNEAIK